MLVHGTLPNVHELNLKLKLMLIKVLRLLLGNAKRELDKWETFKTLHLVATCLITARHIAAPVIYQFWMMMIFSPNSLITQDPKKSVPFLGLHKIIHDENGADTARSSWPPQLCSDNGKSDQKHYAMFRSFFKIPAPVFASFRPLFMC